MVTYLVGMQHLDLIELVDKFAFYIENHTHHPKVISHSWDGKVRFVSLNGVVYTHILEYVLPKIAEMGYELDLYDERVLDPIKHIEVTPDIFKNCLDKYNNPFQLREYQCKVANLLLKRGSGIVVAATSAGKGSIICAMSKVLIANRKKTIIVVPNTTLITQTYEECKQFGLDVGEFSGTVKDLKHKVVVSTWQTLQNQPKILQQFQAFICDECHGSSSTILFELLTEHCVHISLRFGVTGTMPKNDVKRFKVMSALGPVRYRITAKWLMDNGFISTIDIKNIILKESTDHSVFFNEYEAEVAYLTREDRIAALAEIINLLDLKYPTKNVLCLVNHKETGRTLTQMVPDSFYIDGDTKRKNRTATLDRYKNADGLKGIATFGIASTGLSQDRIHFLILFDIGKSFIKVIQSIGRGLRKGGGKDHVTVLDVSSDLNFSMQHYTQRLAHYNEAEYPHKRYNLNIESLDVETLLKIL